MQNTIESFNALWQAKVWQRYRVTNVAELQARSARYIAAHGRTTAAKAMPRGPDTACRRTSRSTCTPRCAAR